VVAMFKSIYDDPDTLPFECDRDGCDVFNAVSNVVNSVVNFIASNPIAKAIVQIGATLAISAILGLGGAQLQRPQKVQQILLIF
jgi:hypothetical protein